jgi:hypothetical protein
MERADNGIFPLCALRDEFYANGSWMEVIDVGGVATILDQKGLTGS